MSVNEKMTAIADAIRDKTGGTDKLGLDDMSQAIPEVYDAGKQAQYDEFWDNYQNYGYRSNYVNAFSGDGWSKELFNPKYVIKPYNASRMFDTNAPGGAKNGTLDLRDYADKFDWSICINVTSLFSYAYIISAVGSVNTSQCAFLNNICNQAVCLHTFEKLILKNDGTQTFSSAFYNATALKNIAIEGVIGNTLDMRWSPLSKDSIIGKLITPEEYEALSDSVKNYNVFEFNGNYYYGGVITALSSTATGKTLTLKKTAVENAFETSEGAADGSTSDEWTTLLGTKTNWTISLA